jgi:hypothetical protein
VIEPSRQFLKVFSNDEEELGAPLLAHEDELGDLTLASNIPRMETDSSSPQTIMTSGPMSNATIRRFIQWALGVRTLADVLPGPLQVVVNSGKISVAFFVGGYFVMVALWFPFWMFSFVVGETGIYCLIFAAVITVGRGIIRMIAFPGSSSVSMLLSVI